MKKVVLTVVLVLAMAGMAAAGGLGPVYDVAPAFDVGPNCYLVSVTNVKGPFGKGFLGTDRGWMLVQKNPATGATTLIASGNGTFDGSGMVAMIGGGAMLGGMNIIAATQVRPSNVRVDANQSQSQGQSQSQSQAQAQAQVQSQKSINVNINKGFIPPGHGK